MIFTLSGIVFFVIGIILVIIGIHYEKTHGCREDEISIVSLIGGLLTIINIVIVLLLSIPSLFVHTDYAINQKRAEIEEQRAAIIQELKREDKDIMLKGIEDAKEFNQELRHNQIKSNNIWFGYVVNPAWKEFEPIEYPE